MIESEVRVLDCMKCRKVTCTPTDKAVLDVDVRDVRVFIRAAGVRLDV